MLTYEKSKIKFKIDLYKNEGIPNLNNDIFPPHFLMTLCGNPGSGKTTLLKFLIKSDKFFFKKFDFVFILSPSYIEYVSFFLPDTNFNNCLDYEWIKRKINMINTEYSSRYINALFILDDVIADIYKSRATTDIMNFTFNRRHLLHNGMISIIVTSQKFTRIPTEIRSCSNVVIFFKLNSMCIKKIFDDLIFEDKEKFDLILDEIFGKGDRDFIIYRLCNNTFYKNFDKINYK